MLFFILPFLTWDGRTNGVCAGHFYKSMKPTMESLVHGSASFNMFPYFDKDQNFFLSKK